MKKYTVLCATLGAAMLFTGCKSSESAYKQAYLKAKQQEEMQQQNASTVQETAENVVVPMTEKPAVNTQVMEMPTIFPFVRKPCQSSAVPV